MKQDKKPSIVKNATFNLIYKVMNMIFPLVTSMYISHVLMSTGVGRFSKVQNIVQYFVLLAPFGISSYGTREIAKLRDDNKKVQHIFSELFLINLCSTFVCSLLFYIMVELFDFENKSLFYVLGLQIIFNVINVEWYFQGYEEYQYIATRSILIKVISLIAIVCFVKTESDLLIYSVIYVLGIAGNYVFNIFNIFRRGVRITFSNLYFSRHFKAILTLLLSSIAIELYTLLDTTMLGCYCDDDVVGYYTNALKLIKVVVVAIAAVGGIMLPRLSYCLSHKETEDANRLINVVMNVTFLMVIPCMIGFYICADDIIIVLFGKTFIPAITTMKVGVLLIPMLAYSNFFGSQILLAVGKERKLLLCTLVGAATNIILNSILIPQFFHNGAILASIASETMVMCMTIVFSCKLVNLKMDKNVVLKSLLISILMLLAIICIRNLIVETIYRLIMSVVIGAITYLIGTIFINKGFINDLRNLM